MLEVILGTLVIVILTTVIAVLRVKKDKVRIICNYNCNNCKEKDVCGIRRD